jgi:hypothetical protein
MPHIIVNCGACSDLHISGRSVEQKKTSIAGYSYTELEVALHFSFCICSVRSSAHHSHESAEHRVELSTQFVFPVDGDCIAIGRELRARVVDGASPRRGGLQLPPLVRRLYITRIRIRPARSARSLAPGKIRFALCKRGQAHRPDRA